jgi:uncharacterized protein (UPF0332 family)
VAEYAVSPGGDPWASPVKEEVRALAAHRLGRAREAVSEGRQLLDTGSPRGAVNRFYYAAFHAARALLATREADSSKHSGVIALFQRHFVKPGLIEPGTARVLARAFAKRQMTDYADFATVTTEEATEIGLAVETFVQACASLVGRLITEDPERDARA